MDMSTLEVPRVVYRKADHRRADHPGHDAQRVENHDALAAALEAGWMLTPDADHLDGPADATNTDAAPASTDAVAASPAAPAGEATTAVPMPARRGRKPRAKP